MLWMRNTPAAPFPTKIRSEKNKAPASSWPGLWFSSCCLNEDEDLAIRWNQLVDDSPALNESGIWIRAVDGLRDLLGHEETAPGLDQEFVEFFTEECFCCGHGSFLQVGDPRSSPMRKSSGGSPTWGDLSQPSPEG